MTVTAHSLNLSTLRSWTFLTNHAQILVALASEPDAPVGELAEAAHITERSAYRILADLQKHGYVRRVRNGRGSRYEINRTMPLRDPTVEHEIVATLLDLVANGNGGRRRPAA